MDAGRSLDNPSARVGFHREFRFILLRLLVGSNSRTFAFAFDVSFSFGTVVRVPRGCFPVKAGVVISNQAHEFVMTGVLHLDVIPAQLVSSILTGAILETPFLTLLS
jgi:hypothetical protein